MRAFTLTILFSLTLLEVFCQAPAITYGEVAYGSLGGDYAATRSGSNFFAAEVIETTTSRSLNIKQLNSKAVVTTTTVFVNSCINCNQSSTMPTAIFPTIGDGAVIFYEPSDGQPRFRKIEATGALGWELSLTNLKFLKAVPALNGSLFAYFRVITGVNQNTHIIYNISEKGVATWTRNIGTIALNDLAATNEGGVVTVDGDSTKRYSAAGAKLWAVKRSGLLVKIIDANEAYVSDSVQLYKIKLVAGQLVWSRLKAATIDLLVGSDSSAILSTNSSTLNYTIAGTLVWENTTGSQRIQLAPNGTIAAVGVGVNANKVYTIAAATGKLIWEKTFTYNESSKLRIFAAADNSWFVKTRGETINKPSTNGFGLIYHLANTVSPCAYLVTISPATKQTICKTGEVNFLVQQTGLDLSFGFPTTDYQVQWRKDSVNVASGMTFKATQAGKYSAVLQQGTCSVASPATEIMVRGNTLPVITSDLVSLCAGGGSMVKLTATGCADGTIKWSDKQTGLSVNVSPTKTTDYTAQCVESYTENGVAKTCSSDSSKILQIKVLAVSDLTLVGGVLGADSVCRGASEVLSVKLGPTFIPGLADSTYTWTKGVTRVVGRLPTLSIDETGAFQVTVKDKRGCSITSSVKNVTQITLQKPTITADITEFCSGSNLSTKFVATGCANLPTKWSDGQLGATISASPTFTTPYSAQCRTNYISSNGNRKECLGEASTAIPVKVLPISDITIAKFTAPEVLCKATIQDTLKTELNNISGAFTSTWFKDGTKVGEGLSLVISESGNYQLKVRDVRGCTLETPLKNIPKSTLTVNVFGDRQFCDGVTTSLKANAVGGVGSNRYEWKLNNNVLSTLDSIRFATPGNYNLLVTDAKGCSEKVATSVQLYPKITGSYAKQTVVKGNLTYNFDPKKLVGGSEPLNLTLSAVTQTNKPVKITGNEIGTFTENSKIFVMVTDLKGCSFTDSISIRYQPCNVNVSIKGAEEFCYYEKNTLTAEPKGVAPYTFVWVRGDETMNEKTALLSTSTQGTYRTTVTDSARCVATSAPFTIKEKGRDINAFIKTNNGDSLAYLPFGINITANTQADVTYQWYRNDSLILNVDVPKLFADRSGKYYIRLLKNGCFNNSNVLNISILKPLGVEKNVAFGAVKAYPNPSDDYLIIQANSQKAVAATLKLFSTSGQQVYENERKTSSTSHEWRVETINWSAGTYIYHISTSDGVVSGKVVKR